MGGTIFITMVIVVIVGGVVFIIFRHLHQLKTIGQNLKISPDRRKGFWTFPGTIRGIYNGHKVLLGSDSEEENVVIHLPFTTPLKAGFYMTSDNTTLERIISQPLFKKWYEYHLPEVKKAYQVIKYTAEKEIIPIIGSNEMFEKLSELVEAIAPYEGHFYLNEQELKLKFPFEAKLEEEILKTGCQIYDFICSLSW